MAFSKAHLFKDNEHLFSLVCKALSHPARLRIIRTILDHSPQFVSTQNIIKDIPLKRPTITRHFSVLRNMKIIESKTEGVHTYHRLNRSLELLFIEVFTVATSMLPEGTTGAKDEWQAISPHYYESDNKSYS